MEKIREEHPDLTMASYPIINSPEVGPRNPLSTYNSVLHMQN